MRSSLFCALMAFLPGTPSNADGLEGFLQELNVQAQVDRQGFTARMGAQFSTSEVQVRAILRAVKEPADAFMVFQLGQMTRQPIDRVLTTYKTHRGEGWGAMAKALGIKPGSPEFHALKRGDFRLGGHPGDRGHHPGKGRGKKK